MTKLFNSITKLTSHSQIYIFGAKSLALGASEAIMRLYPNIDIKGFVVSSMEGNPLVLNGLKVYDIADITDKNTFLFVAVPQDIQGKIAELLDVRGYHNYLCMDWALEAWLMGQLYKRTEDFNVLPDIDFSKGASVPLMGDIHCYVTKFYRDKSLCSGYILPDWVEPIQAGAELTDVRVCDTLDNIGDNISRKNVNYCELTALYWVWKHVLNNGNMSGKQYYGFYQYRRLLDINAAKFNYIVDHNIDAVLPYPTMCEPDMLEHHSRYVRETDWDAMMQALSEIRPDYYKVCADIFHQRFMYNYNILLAKADVLMDYCAWLFPILARTEELSVPKGSERADRYIGYLGENLLTLYFMYNRDRYKIAHTGRVMLV